MTILEDICEPTTENDPRKAANRKIEKYLCVDSCSEQTKLLVWWKNYEAQFHVFTKPPQMNLCIPATFVPSESTADQYVVNFVCFLRCE